MVCLMFFLYALDRFSNSVFNRSNFLCVFRWIARSAGLPALFSAPACTFRFWERYAGNAFWAELRPCCWNSICAGPASKSLWPVSGLSKVDGEEPEPVRSGAAGRSTTWHPAKQHTITHASTCLIHCPMPITNRPCPTKYLACKDTQARLV